MSCLRKNRWCGSLPIKPYVLSNAICLGILCITSFSAFPTQLNQQVTSANLSEIGVMQRLLSSMHVRHQNQKAHRQITQRCAGCTAVTFLRPSKIGAACSRLVLAVRLDNKSWMRSHQACLGAYFWSFQAVCILNFGLQAKNGKQNFPRNFH